MKKIVLLLLFAMLLQPCFALGGDSIFEADLTVNGSACHLELGTISIKDGRMDIEIKGVPEESTSLLWASAFISGVAVPADSVAWKNGSCVFSFTCTALPEAMTIYPYNDANHGVYVWKDAYYGPAVLPEEMIGAWRGSVTEHDGPPVELTFQIDADSSAELTFAQDNHTEICTVSLAYEESTFAPAEDSGSVSRFQGTWFMENGQMTIQMNRTLPSGKVYSYTVPCTKPENGERDTPFKNALQDMKEEKYYSAYAAFLASTDPDAARQAEKCVQPWPANGEVWRVIPQGGTVSLMIEAEQAADSAMLIKIKQGQTPVSYVFIGGSGKVSVSLPGGTYTICDGTGKEWFGIREAFGRAGHYETLSFDGAGTQQAELKSGNAYVLSINVSEIDPNASNVGSKDESWEAFAE